MEKIFKDYRVKIEDGGFSDSVMDRITAIGRPTRNMYRVPTMLAALTLAVAVLFVVKIVGIEKFNERYNYVTHYLKGDIHIDESSNDDTNSRKEYFETENGIPDPVEELE